MRLNIQGLTDLSGPAMFVGFHPDDIDFHASGLAALLSRAGVEVIYVVATSGEGGGNPKVREHEQILSAEAVGVKKVVFLRFKDGSLFKDFQKGRLQNRLTLLIRRYKPGLIVSMCPGNLRSVTWGAEHPDHRYGALALWDAIYPAARQNESRNWKNLFRRLHTGHKVSQVFWFGDDLENPNSANCFVPVDQVWPQIENALSSHESQWDEFDIKAKAQLRARRLADRWSYKGLAEEYHQIDFQ